MIWSNTYRFAAALVCRVVARAPTPLQAVWEQGRGGLATSGLRTFGLHEAFSVESRGVVVVSCSQNKEEDYVHWR